MPIVTSRALQSSKPHEPDRAKDPTMADFPVSDPPRSHRDRSGGQHRLVSAALRRRPAMDGEANGYRHVVFPLAGGQLFGLHTLLLTQPDDVFQEMRAGWTMSPSAAPAGTSWKGVWPGPTSLASPTGRSSMPTTVWACLPRSRQHRS